MVNVDRQELENLYFDLAQKLEFRYHEFSFQNHCYWRIALDNAMQGRWDFQISRPAYKHLSIEQLKRTVSFLQSYLIDRELLLEHNQKSLDYRKG